MTMATSNYFACRIVSSILPTTAFLLLLTTCSLLLSVVIADEPNWRIVNGNDADPAEYPFFAQWGSSCGATLIHDDILLTAAHVSSTNEIGFCYILYDLFLLSDTLGFFFPLPPPPPPPPPPPRSAIHSPLTKSLLVRTRGM